MVVLRRRQLNLIRGCVFLIGLLGMLAFLYYFTEDTKEIQRKLENVLRDINEDTGKSEKRSLFLVHGYIFIFHFPQG